jgi:nitrogen-specific signal transduction histidine kinase
VKNPLAALQGAAEYLREEQCRRGAPVEERDFVALMLREVERLRRMVEAHEAALRATAAEGGAHVDTGA